MQANYDDWWWKERLGKCYYMLGLFREAEKQVRQGRPTAIGTGAKVGRASRVKRRRGRGKR